ncbi:MULTISPECIES: alpha-hydroxy acid oxidase [Paraburkholderia]|uniref:Alpha-hydroxy acid oxidase n=3 Tax=Paraburkholderia TaxID=1822464 RepID=A0A5C6V6H5_9BURK|nr:MULTISPECIES: alpha-hydroxy acid oxidase [Paraburkholderia]SKC98745.1 FMN-dependent dehydrogenase, includes L-lactate dehydrogenase and type II isopentenyl diphosphate isomerase [Burkholderia sp. CF099]AUT73714.1 alpha-hydroxy-acid oxidizing enzyme [Paraburkholderia hospita]AXF03349.1 alpha-hydroxy-acid oxidizing protein [Paraburkholderia hospita]MDW3662874.1 alpha-hydroxy acid oxidase [Paraburkholderia terrae]OUL81284.1 alpha-hydroxy-acid oxidizing enzyme [Paraburkholderia hospita]
MSVITCVEDLRLMAKKRVPKAFYDYVDSGSYSESTYRENSRAFDDLKLQQRVAVNVEGRSTASTMIGQPVTMPVAIAPTGLAGMQWANGEMLGALAAKRFGVPFTLSTVSICSIEDVARHTAAPFWFQLYVMRDRGFNASLIERAKLAGCSALVVTLDLQINGQRHKDLKNGMTVPPRLTASNLLDFASKPGWMMRALRGAKTFGNLAGYIKGGDDVIAISKWVAQQFDPTLGWDDLVAIRRGWDRKLVLKGILSVEDARMAASIGADAIVVSNHGGRQLDGAPPSIEALPAIVEAVGDKIEIWVDGGIRSGQDVMKALALGAKGTMVGRAFMYALGAMGEAGVTRMLQILQSELDVSMALSGVRTIGEIGRHNLFQRRHDLLSRGSLGESQDRAETAIV